MPTVILYHNPDCSKSRATLDLLRSHGVEPTVIDYLKTPPTMSELKTILNELGLRARDLVRTGEDVFRALDLDRIDNDEAVLHAMVENPILIERPIVRAGGRAVIGRPPEAVLEIL